MSYYVDINGDALPTEKKPTPVLLNTLKHLEANPSDIFCMNTKHKYLII